MPFAVAGTAGANNMSQSTALRQRLRAWHCAKCLGWTASEPAGRVLTTIQTCEYDEDANVTAIHVENLNEENGAFEQINRVQYRLNDYGKLDESLTKKVIDGQLTNLQRFTYIYSQQDEISEYTGFDGSQMELFPNPTTRLINLNSLKNEQITIVDESGREVLHIENDEDERLTIDVSNWEAGVYTIRSNNGETQKFIKK
jgi:hypothetical protein